MKKYLTGQASLSPFALLTFVSIIILSTGCSLTSVKPDPALTSASIRSEGYAEFMQNQNKLLFEQSIQLNQLTRSQVELAKQVEGLKKQLKQVSLQISDEKVKSKKAADRKEIVQSKRVPAESKIVIGRNEWVWLDALGHLQKARVDTGARSSSLSASNIQPFERDGKKWVRFSVPGDPAKRVIETPLMRYTKIKHASLEGGRDRRPVVKLKVRLGELVEHTEFTLANREGMLYPVLLGRSFLQDIAVVDVALKFTQAKWRGNSPKVTSK